MQKHRVEFRIGDIFSPDDIISQRIISICMAINDLIYVMDKMLVELQKKSLGAERRTFYLFRLGCSHLFEAKKALDDMEKQPELKKIFDKLPNRSKLSFEELKKEYNLLDKVVAKIRHKFFHYMKLKEIKSSLNEIRNDNSEVIIGKELEDFFIKVAYDISANLLKRWLEEAGETLESGVQRIQKMVANFWILFTDLFMTFIKTFPKEKYRVEKIENC